MSHWWLLKKGVPFHEGRLATLRLPMHAPVDDNKSRTCGYHQLDSIDILKQKEDMKLGKRRVVKDPGTFRGREWEANKSTVHKFLKFSKYESKSNFKLKIITKQDQSKIFECIKH